jgi:hypothetical protein
MGQPPSGGTFRGVASTGNLPAIDRRDVGRGHGVPETRLQGLAPATWRNPTPHGHRSADAVTLPSPMPGSATPYPAARATAERRPHRSRPRRHRPVVRPEVGDQRNRYGRPMTPQAVISVMRCHAGRAALLTPAVTVTRVSAGCCWWWACQDLNLGPHPYQVSRAKRCADRRFPRSPPSVRGEGMRS